MNGATENECPDKSIDSSNENETSLNPAILGVRNPHGIKLPPRMSSRDKQQLMIKLDERRKTRIEKLEARILAKQKAMKKAKIRLPLSHKIGSSPTITEHTAKGNQNKQSVFARLYRNSSNSGHSKCNGNLGPITKPADMSPEVELKSTSENSIVYEGTSSEIKESEKSSFEKENMIEETGSDSFNEDNAFSEINSTSNKQMSTLFETSFENDFNLEYHLEIHENKEMQSFLTEENEGSIEKVFTENPLREAESNNVLDEVVSEKSSTQDILNVEEKKESSNEILNITFSKESNSENPLDAEIEGHQNEDLNKIFSEETKPQNSLDLEEHKESLDEVLREQFSEDSNSQNIANENTEINKESKTENAGNLLPTEATEKIRKKEFQFETQGPPSKIESLDKSPKFVLPPNSNASKEKTNGEMKSDVAVKSNTGQKSKPPIRRSISMLFRQKSRVSTISRASSDQSLYKPNKPIHRLCRVNDKPPLPIKKPQQTNPKPVKSVTFATPKNKFHSSTDIRNQLEDWLNAHGHSSESYRHLRCFGIVNHLTPARVNKRTITEVPETPTKEFLLDESDKENLTPPSATSQATETEVENWLKELYKLITELKYPEERCEEWLTAITKKCNTCVQMPLYWECRAALDESKGNVQSAIENYQTAIIKGKDVESVGDSLANLFDKMVLEQKKPSKSKIEKGIDPKNIFKSTVIKFALQKKNLKEKKEEQTNQQEKLVVTPVRRSSRIRTPSKTQVVSSFQSLTPELREKVTFKPNMSFLG